MIAPRRALPWRWIGRLTSAGCVIAAAAYGGRGRWLIAGVWLLLAFVPVALALPRGRRLYFALAAIAFSSLTTIAFVAGLDLYLHYRFADRGGYNVWGYRGPAAGAKRAGEFRLVMLGGSVAFGYGVSATETIPHFLEQRLNQLPRWSPARVVNLGWNSEGAYSFAFTLQDYDYLEYDGAILYSGYNDLGENTRVFRHQSPVFKLTGYLPILPIVPVRQWLRIEDLSETRNGKVVFRPNLADRYAAEAADAALRISRALEEELKRLAPDDPPPGAPSPSVQPEDLRRGCETEWIDYCRSMERAIEYASGRGKHVIVVSEPYKDARHIRQQAAVALMLQRRFAGNPLVHYLDMGHAVDLEDPSLCYDGLHLTAAGNARVADTLAANLSKVMPR
jgi:hypothetical protein